MSSIAIAAPEPSVSPVRTYRQSVSRYRNLGLGLIALFVVGFGGFAAIAPLSSAVIAVGRLEVVGSIKKVQHETGGTVSDILVTEGQHVTAGDVLLRLDATTASATRTIIVRKLDELYLARARLRAERDLSPSFALPAELADRATDPDVTALSDAEQRLFTVRLASREGEKQQLAARISQYRDQIAGIDTQATAKATELRLTRTELDNARALAGTGVGTQVRANDLERALASLEGEAGALTAQKAELGGRIAETELQRLNIDQSATADAGRDLKDTESQIGELQQRLLAAEEQLARTEIRAPISGSVHELQAHTVGGVIAAGSVVMTIVPTDGPLDVEARLSPIDIEAVHPGQSATIRFPGLNHSSTPDLMAEVSVVGAGLVEDPATRQSYYPVTLKLAPEELDRLGDIALVAGMPVETFIDNGKRTLIDYLVAPIRDRMSHALRER
jgi:HlyD family secretion protein